MFNSSLRALAFGTILSLFWAFSSPIWAHNSGCSGHLVLPSDHPYWSYQQRIEYVKKRVTHANDSDDFDDFMDEIDLVLGINTSAVEQHDLQSWAEYSQVLGESSLTKVNMLGLKRDHRSWFTSYRDLALLITGLNLKTGDTVVDLGAGTGRLGLLLSVLRPDISYVGVELVKSRVEAARRAVEKLGAQNRIRFVESDLLDPYLKIPDGTHYYLYGPTNDVFVNAAVIERLEYEKDGSFKVITHHPLTIQALKVSALKFHKQIPGSRFEFNVFKKTP